MGDPFFCKYLCPQGVLEGASPLSLTNAGIRAALGKLFTWKACILPVSYTHLLGGKGVPLRLEIGPKDLEKNQCVLVRRVTREKVFVSLDELETAIPAQLEACLLYTSSWSLWPPASTRR